MWFVTFKCLLTPSGPPPTPLPAFSCRNIENIYIFDTPPSRMRVFGDSRARVWCVLRNVQHGTRTNVSPCARENVPYICAHTGLHAYLKHEFLATLTNLSAVFVPILEPLSRLPRKRLCILSLRRKTCPSMLVLPGLEYSGQQKYFNRRKMESTTGSKT
jgi:hypothetical protein